jgi:hypothetical protein
MTELTKVTGALKKAKSACATEIFYYCFGGKKEFRPWKN